MIIGDLHFKAEMGYADYVKDGRREEKKNVLDFIVKLANDCQGVVLLGDNLNNRNNPSSVIKEFVSFVERFRGKEIYVLGGNHTKIGTGSSAEDFMKEIENPNWHIITNKIEKINNLVFLPYFYKSEVGVNTNEKLKNYLVKNLPEGDYLFGHHAFSGVKDDYINSEFFNEVLMPLDKLKDKYKKIFIGHIHQACQIDNLYQVGSTFTHEAGEYQKRCCILDLENDSVVSHILPNRAIYKLDNPSALEIQSLPDDCVAKIFIRPSNPDYLSIKELLTNKNISFNIIEKVEQKRDKFVEEENLVDLSLNDLLKIYAKQKNVSAKSLLEGFDLIK